MLDNLTNIDLEAVTEPFKQYLSNLAYDDKLFTVRKIVDKVVATKEKVSICGNIPVYATSLTLQKVDFNANYSDIQNATQPNTEGHVKLDAKYRDRGVA